MKDKDMTWLLPVFFLVDIVIIWIDSVKSPSRWITGFVMVKFIVVFFLAFRTEWADMMQRHAKARKEMEQRHAREMEDHAKAWEAYRRYREMQCSSGDSDDWDGPLDKMEEDELH